MKILERIADRRTNPHHPNKGGTVVRRERKGKISGPYLVCQENADTPLQQDGYIHGTVRMFLVDLASGYRAIIEDDDVFFEITTELVLRD